MSSKMWQRIFSVLLLAGMLLGLVQPLPVKAAAPAEEPTLASIDSDLLVELEQNGSAAFFVMMDAKADLSEAEKITDWSERGWFVYNALLETARTSQAEVIAYAKKNGIEYRSFYTNNSVYFPNGTGQMVQDLAAIAGVERLRLEGYATIQPEELAPTYGPEITEPASPDAYGYNLTTLAPAASGGLYGMQAVQVWETYGIKGNGIVVANIDTGANYSHEALVRQYRGNNGDGTFDHNYNWYLPTSGCGDGTYACDNNGHGSGTMGIMVGETADLSEQIGIAPEATWMACKGCEENNCSDAALTGCADWMVAPCAIGDDPGDPSCDPDMRPHIINNSWGGPGGDTWYQAYVQAWVAAGMFPAFSAGNDYTCNSLGSPGDNPESFGTAAHSSAGENTYAGGPSTFYPNPSCDPDLHEIDPHISSPTFGRTSDMTPGLYYNLSGTSGASPHTAGAVALIWAANPSYIGNIEGTFTALEQSANHDYFSETGCGKPACAGSNNWPNYEYGWGFLDALAAVEYVGVGEMGALDGTVTDASTSDLLQGVTITAEPEGSGGSQSATTDASGYYTMSLMAGFYTVTATSPYYTTDFATHIEIVTDTVTTQDFVLDAKGVLWGYVTDADSGFGLDATVTADNGESLNTNPSDGAYELYLDAGTYAVTAAATDYAPETATGLVIVSGDDLQQDFALLAAVSFAPTPLELTLTLGDDGTVPVTLTNNQPTAYDFEFVEALGEYVPMAGEDVLVVANDTAAATAMETALTANGYSYLRVTTTAFNAMPVADILAYKAVFHAGNSYSTSTQPKLIEYLDAGGSLYISDNDLGFFNNTTVFYQTYLQATYVSDAPANTAITGEDIMAGFNPDISADPYPDDFTVNAEGTLIFRYAGGTAAGVAVDRAGYKAIYTSFDFDDIANVADETELVARVMDYLAAQGVPWFAIDPASGTVPATDHINATAAFTATAALGVAQPGEYHMDLVVDGDPSVEVPVVLYVEPAATQGQVDGTVTSDRPGGPLEATLVIEDSGGVTYTVTSDPDTGYYSYWLEEGTYTVTASFPGYLDGAAVVVITAGALTTQDFELVLDAPDISVAPGSLDVTVTFGDSISETLTVENNGTLPLDFEISEGDEAYSPNAGEDVLVVANDTAAATAMETALTANGYSYLRVTTTAFNAMPVADILAYKAVFHAGNSYSTSTQPKLIEYLDAGGSLYISDNDLGFFNNTTVFYQTYLQATYVSDAPANTAITGEDIMAGFNPDISADPYPDDFTVNAEGTLIFRYAGGTAAGVAVDRAGYKAIYTSFDFDDIANVADETELVSRVAGYLMGSDILWVTEEPISGTVSVGGSLGVDVTFDSSVVLEPGVYQANLSFKSNDPIDNRLNVPVTMTVEPTADLGLLEGTVTSDRPGGPLEATLVIEDSGGVTYTVTSDPATGTYYRWLYEGNYTVTASAPGYLPDEAVVVIVGTQTTVQDFELILEQPEIVVDPLSMEETLVFGEVASQTLYIDNIGYADLEFSLREQDRGTYPLAAQPAPVGAPAPVAAVEPEIMRLPDGSVDCAAYENYPLFEPVEVAAACGNPELAQTIVGANAPAAPTDMGYAQDVRNDRFVSFALNNWPGQTIISVDNSVYGMDFDPTGTILYALNDTTGQLGTIDLATGAFTGLVSCPPGGGAANWSGLTIDPMSGVFYGSTATDLFIIDPATGASTLVGSFGTTLMIEIAINAEGAMYGHDIGTDSIYSIDIATGAATLIGLTGYAANYAQGMDFDNDDGTLYIWLYMGSDANVYGTVNLTTGAVTPLATTNPGGEFEGATQTVGAADIPWLSEDPISGTIPMDETGEVAVTFDSSQVPEPGTYIGTLHVNSNDPYENHQTIAVTLTVLPSGEIGLLDGIVESMGYCDANPAPVEAEIIAENGAGDTWTILNDGTTGYYSRWLPADTYTLTASAADHISSAEVVVVVSEQMTTTQDFELRWLAPCLIVDPAEFDVTVAQGYSRTLDLDLVNMGALGTDFELSETAGGYTSTLMLPGSTTAIESKVEVTIGDLVFSTSTLPSGVAKVPQSAPKGPDAVSITHSASQTIIAGNSVSCNAGGLHSDNSYLRVFTLADFGITGPFDITSVDIGIETAAGAGGTQPVDVNLYTLSGSLIWANMTLIGTTSTTVSDQSLSIVTIPVEGTAPAGSTLVVEFFTPDGQAAGHSLFVGSNNLGQTAPSYLAAADCGITEPGDTAGIGFPEMQIVMNVTGEVGSGDVPWVFETPVTGTVDADSAFTVDMTFVATETMPLGTYTATLVVASDDPENDPIEVPLTMHVVEEYVAPTAEFTATSPVCQGEPVVFVNLTDPGIPSDGTYLWDFGDGITDTVADPSHIYAEAGTYTVTLTACNEGGCDDFSLDVEILPLPVAGFSYVATDLSVVFTNESTDADTYAWDFGDEITDTVASPTHVYAEAGTYTVTLWAFNDCGVAMVEEVITVVETPAGADLSLTKEGPASVDAGATITYTLTVANAGPGPALNVVLEDTLPAGVTFVSATTPCTQTGGVVTCALGEVASGASAVIEIVVTAPETPGTITNNAVVSSDTTDPDEANNEAALDTVIAQVEWDIFLPILFKG